MKREPVNAQEYDKVCDKVVDLIGDYINDYSQESIEKSLRATTDMLNMTLVILTSLFRHAEVSPELAKKIMGEAIGNIYKGLDNQEKEVQE